MDTVIAEKIIYAAKGKLDACEVCFVRSESKEAEFASNKLKNSKGKGSRAVAVRGFLNGRMGFYATSDLSSVEDIVNITLELAREGSPHEIELPSDFGNATVDLYDPKIADLPPADHVGMGRELIEMVQAKFPKFLNDANIWTEVEDVFLLNSAGGQGDFKRTAVTALISPSLADESGYLEVYEYDFFSKFPASGFSHLAERAINKLKYCEKDAKAETGGYEILLMPKGTAIFGPLMLAMSARAVIKGYSPWLDKLGEKVVDERFEVVDDPLIDGYLGSQPFDDEGTPSRKKTIIGNGVLNLFYNDLFSAAKLGQQPTGNAFKQGSGAAPRASASTLFIKEGEKDFDALVASMKKGIIVDEVMGAHQSSPFSGDFSVNIGLGWLVENGTIVGRLKDCMLAGNIFNWLKDGIIEIGRGVEKPSTSLAIPPILFSEGKIATG